MTPAFHSWAQFVAMGGYGFYVWLSVIVTVSVMLVLTLHSFYQRHQLLIIIASRQERERRIIAAKKRKQNVGEG
ncbi:heme exporter protein CcmD [Rosenbergiella australiborealis]|uniref:Heme exporter protein D n=1 Tax=Rosenbergiella australiborealis TaxID=1544696 RepID=A0ABS5T5E2_9GAMM|nr:heme exporter protein CcmD [Rosenbergiella australiborealis]MBT0726705.1 heme exporter protein CcmD [Rosenbergiella australiborealis]